MHALFRILVPSLGVLLTTSAVAGALVLHHEARSAAEAPSRARVPLVPPPDGGDAPEGFVSSNTLTEEEAELLRNFCSGYLNCGYGGADGCAPDRGGEILALAEDAAP